MSLPCMSLGVPRIVPVHLGLWAWCRPGRLSLLYFSIIILCSNILWFNGVYWYCLLFRSTLMSWPNKVGLKCPSVRTYVCVSTKGFFNFNEIWYVGRGRWEMHDSMQYDQIHGQRHEPLKVGNLFIFKSYRLRHLQRELATDHWFLN